MFFVPRSIFTTRGVYYSMKLRSRAIFLHLWRSLKSVSVPQVSCGVNAALTKHFVFCFAEEQRCRRQRWLWWWFWLSQQPAAPGTPAACSSLCLQKSGLSKSKNPVKQELVCLQNDNWMPRRNWVGKTVQQKNQKLFIPLTDSPDWYTWKQCSGKAAF